MAVLNRMHTLSSVKPLSPLEAHSLSPSPAAWLAGSSAAMTQLRGQIRRVAPYFRTALLTGERDCGEEAAAHILHQLSPLGHHAFLELTPAEADLRFTSGTSPEHVTMEGMLYLPQPERLPRNAQTALLRLLRERGSQAPRIVAFAERGLRPLVSTGGFSAELADSLGALRIILPPLRERREDIPELLTQMVQDIATKTRNTPPQLAPDLLEAAMQLSWPGNFAQLQSTAEGLIEHAAKLAPHAVNLLRAIDLETVLGAIPTATPHDRREIRLVRLDDVIQEHIRAVLFACNGNKLRTAEVLGISRSTLYRMLEAQTGPASQQLSDLSLQMAG
jgi:DNA-binding NtrC family response regulator